MLKDCVRISDEVKQALSEGRAVVALESTIIAHGMPYPQNVETAYEVDKISIVEPSQVSELQIVEGEDLCTLVACTPYGINTHRLLVRGHRIENIQSSAAIRVTSDALQIDPLIVAPIAAAPILLVLLVLLLLPKRQYPSHGGNKDENI